MIPFFFSGLSGKTSYAKRYGYGTLRDLIISQGLFGSTDFFGHHSDVPSCVSNSLIPISWIPSGFYELDAGCWHDRYFLYSPYGASSNIKLDHLLVSKPEDVNADDIINCISNIKAPSTKYQNIISYSSIGKTPLGYDNLIDLGISNPLYIKSGSTFFCATNNLDEVGVCCPAPVCFFLRVRYITIENKQYRLVELLGCGFLIATDDFKFYVAFALDHSKFTRGVSFCGFPYIKLTEGGPVVATSYKVGYRYSESMLKFALSDSSNNRTSPDVFSWLQNVPPDSFVVNRRNTAGLKFRSLICSDFRAISLPLLCDRSFLDSIAQLVLLGSGAILPGGLPASVVLDSIYTQERDCLVIYGPLGDSESDDSLLRYMRDAQISGSLFATFSRNGYFENLAFTSRTAPDRVTIYHLIHNDVVYGNRIQYRVENDGTKVILRKGDSHEKFSAVPKDKLKKYKALNKTNVFKRHDILEERKAGNFDRSDVLPTAVIWD